MQKILFLLMVTLLTITVPHKALAGGSNLENIGDNTCRDKGAGLMWQIPISKRFNTADAALEYVKALNLANHDDWRLPSAQEAQELRGLIAIQGNDDCKFSKLEKPFWLIGPKQKIVSARMELDCLCSGDIDIIKRPKGRVRAVRSLK